MGKRVNEYASQRAITKNGDLTIFVNTPIFGNIYPTMMMHISEYQRKNNAHTIVIVHCLALPIHQMHRIMWRVDINVYKLCVSRQNDKHSRAVIIIQFESDMVERKSGKSPFEFDIVRISATFYNHFRLLIRSKYSTVAISFDFVRVFRQYSYILSIVFRLLSYVCSSVIVIVIVIIIIVIAKELCKIIRQNIYKREERKNKKERRRERGT